MGRNIFMTGGGGFLGKGLVDAMLQDHGTTIYLLSRSAEGESRFRMETPSTARHRIKFVHGDVTLPGLGFSADDRMRLANRIDEVWHVAASTHFDNSKKEELEATNVTGTLHTVKLARTFTRLQRYYAISTAYICGTGLESVSETGMPQNEDFKNSYERTKYRAEEVIRRSDLPFVVIRPSIIMGHSLTGEARGDTRMFYGGLLALYRSALQVCQNETDFWHSWHQTRHGHFIDLNARAYGRAETTKNLVTVDDVVNVSMAIRRSPSAVRKTFNVVNKNNLSVGCLVDAMQRALRITGIRFHPDLSLKEIREKHHPVEVLLHRHNKSWWPYLLHSEPTWEMKNVDALGVKRVDMTAELFEFLMHAYTTTYLAKPLSRPSPGWQPAARADATLRDSHLSLTRNWPSDIHLKRRVPY